MMRQHQALNIVIALVAMIPRLQCATFDPATDFSLTNNPNGVWSYGYQTALGSGFTAYTVTNVSGGMENWKGAAPDPNVGHNRTASPITAATATWPAGQFSLHPGPSGEYCVLRFMAPETGSYSLNAQFVGLDSNPTTTDVHVLTNGFSLFDSFINLNAVGNSTSYSNLSLALDAGEFLDFAVGRGNGFHGFDTTGLTLQISLIPEPAAFTLALTLSGAALVAGFRRRIAKTRANSKN